MARGLVDQTWHIVNTTGVMDLSDIVDVGQSADGTPEIGLITDGTT